MVDDEPEDIREAPDDAGPQALAPVPTPERRTNIRFWAVGAGVFALLPELIYNVWPSAYAAFHGEGSAIALMAVRIGAVVAMATVPRTREYRGTIAFLVLFGLWSAYVSGQVRHDNETAGPNEKITLAAQYNAKLAELRTKLQGWKATFTAVSQETADADVRSYNEAVRARWTCNKYRCAGTDSQVTAARNRMNATLAQRTRTVEYEKLAADIARNEESLSKLGYVPASASTMDAQVASGLHISESAAAALQIAFVALFVEWLNRTLPRLAHNSVLRMFGEKTYEEEAEERNLEALERKGRRLIAEHKIIECEAVARVDAQNSVNEARAEAARQEADRKAQAALDEKRRQAALLAAPVTDVKEAKTRERLEKANDKLKRQRERAARTKRDNKDKEAKKRGDATVWVKRFFDEQTSPLPYGVDPQKARIKMADFRKRCNSWVKSKGGTVENDPIKFGLILAEVGKEFVQRTAKRVHIVGLELMPGTPEKGGKFTLHSIAF